MRSGYPVRADSLVGRRKFLAGLGSVAMSAALPATGILGLIGATSAALAADIRMPLRLRNAHTDERAAVALFDGRAWNRKSLLVCDWLLRDHRESDARRMDPRLYAALYVLQRAAGPTAEITILSGFRTRKTNDMLRRRGIGAAADSYHMKACAVDFRIGTISPTLLAKAVRALDIGGAGLYSSFVHMDTGPRRTWGRDF